MPQPPKTPWEKARDNRRRSQRSEREAAKLAGGRVTPMSGGGRIKGDVLTSMWLIEDKLTDKLSFSVTVELLRKICKEAAVSGRLPILRITLPGFKLRVYREEDALYLHALADKARDADID